MRVGDELFHRIREYRLKAESKLVRVIDTLVYRKREVPLIGHFVKGGYSNNNTGPVTNSTISYA